MLGGSRPLGFPTLLDARQDANSPHAAVWTTASLGGLALFSDAPRWTLAPRQIHPPSSALALDQRRKTQRHRIAHATCGAALRVTLDAPCFSSLVERQLTLSSTTAAGHSLVRGGAVKSLPALGRRHPCLVAPLDGVQSWLPCRAAKTGTADAALGGDLCLARLGAHIPPLRAWARCAQCRCWTHAELLASAKWWLCLC